MKLSEDADVKTGRSVHMRAAMACMSLPEVVGIEQDPKLPSLGRKDPAACINTRAANMAMKRARALRFNHQHERVAAE